MSGKHHQIAAEPHFARIENKTWIGRKSWNTAEVRILAKSQITKTTCPNKDGNQEQEQMRKLDDIRRMSDRCDRSARASQFYQGQLV
mmetsp:Transcript_102073/g.192030  ORF Transcript_102073/g.192030 Transcript_102073/m.192030 type:complete len:87 (+) Transcript_102073:742-1002(+)